MLILNKNFYYLFRKKFPIIRLKSQAHVLRINTLKIKIKNRKFILQNVKLKIKNNILIRKEKLQKLLYIASFIVSLQLIPCLKKYDNAFVKDTFTLQKIVKNNLLPNSYQSNKIYRAVDNSSLYIIKIIRGGDLPSNKLNSSSPILTRNSWSFGKPIVVEGFLPRQLQLNVKRIKNFFKRDSKTHAPNTYRGTSGLSLEKGNGEKYKPGEKSPLEMMNREYVWKEEKTPEPLSKGPKGARVSAGKGGDGPGSNGGGGPDGPEDNSDSISKPLLEGYKSKLQSPTQISNDIHDKGITQSGKKVTSKKDKKNRNKNKDLEFMAQEFRNRPHILDRRIEEYEIFIIRDGQAWHKVESHGVDYGLPCYQLKDGKEIAEKTQKNVELFKTNIAEQVKRSTKIEGTYRKGTGQGSVPNVTYFYERETKLCSIFNSETGNFISGWRLSRNQIDSLIEIQDVFSKNNKK